MRLESPVGAATWLPVLFFKKILKFDRAEGSKGEKRSAARHPVGQTFPVKAVLNVVDRDSTGQLIEEGRRRTDWGGWMLNLSATGASMQLHPAALAVRGDPCVLRLSFDNSILEIPGRIAHFRAQANYALCGVSLDFPDAEVHRAYLQLLEPIKVGDSFRPVDPGRVKQDSPDMKKEQYSGDAGTRLTVWRTADGSTIYGFELLIGPYSVTGSNQSPELDVQAAGGSQEVDLSPGACDEMRRLYRWIVPNLAKSVPADVRKFLGRF